MSTDKYTYKCTCCNKTFTAKNKRREPTCSKKCYDIARWRKHNPVKIRSTRKAKMDGYGNPLQCSVDGCDNDVSSAGMCSKHYGRLRAHGTTDKISRVASVRCMWCGDVMQVPASKVGVVAYCSRSCSSKGVARGKGQMLHQSKQARDSYYSAMRRSALSSGEAIDPIWVFNRDQWKCHLCGVKTDRAKRGTYDDLAPELDHIVTLNDGGEHKLYNVACSCRKCNLKKNKRSLGQIGLDLSP